MVKVQKVKHLGGARFSKVDAPAEPVVFAIVAYNNEGRKKVLYVGSAKSGKAVHGRLFSGAGLKHRKKYKEINDLCQRAVAKGLNVGIAFLPVKEEERKIKLAKIKKKLAVD